MRLTLLASLALATLATPAVASDLFLHIEVRDLDGESRAQINLPVGMVDKGLAMMPRSVRVDGQITVAGMRLSRSDLERLHGAVRGLRPGESDTLRMGGRRVEVSRRDGQVTLDVPARRPWQDDVRMRMPLPVLQALLGGAADTLDLAAGIHEMARHEGGSIRIADRDGSSEARLWIDDRPEAGE